MNAMIGQSVRRREDVRFITGRGRYTDDINLPGQAYAAFARSPLARATIRAIDTAAITMPGVQYPHCKAWFSLNASCMGCIWLSDGARPSMVMISAPSAWTASMVQDLTDSPSTNTVHAPHEEVSHPMLVPVSPTTSRM